MPLVPTTRTASPSFTLTAGVATTAARTPTSFLDGDVLADRVAVWTDRLREADPRRCTILATEGGLVGFANTFLDNDPTWGALLDNLHVTAGRKRQGIGAQLLALTAEAVTERRPRSGLYLWVVEQNVDAQACDSHDYCR